MKIITWRDLLELKGDIVWSYYYEYDFDTPVHINFGEVDKPVQSLCEERFPITTPEVGGRDLWDTSDIFSKVGSAPVSELETSGDITSSVVYDRKVIIYNQKDIDSWKSKLESLVIKY